jgi:hypothetical protein
MPRYATHSTGSPPSAAAVELRRCVATRSVAPVCVVPALPSHSRGHRRDVRCSPIRDPCRVRRMSWSPEDSGAISANAPADSSLSRPLLKASSSLRRSLTSSGGQPAKSEARSGCGSRCWPSSAPPGSCQSHTSSLGGASLAPSRLIRSLARAGWSAERRPSDGQLLQSALGPKPMGEPRTTVDKSGHRTLIETAGPMPIAF